MLLSCYKSRMTKERASCCPDGNSWLSPTLAVPKQRVSEGSFFWRQYFGLVSGATHISCRGQKSQSSPEEICLAGEWVHRTEIMAGRISRATELFHSFSNSFLPPLLRETVRTDCSSCSGLTQALFSRAKRKLFSSALWVSSSLWLWGFWLFSWTGSPRSRIILSKSSASDGPGGVG